MKKLIEIQALIMRIEDLTLGNDPKHKSKFLYKDAKTMKIECFCWEQARTYKDLLGHTTGMVVYMRDNSTIEINVW